jgi:site-specific recombinase XerD
MAGLSDEITLHDLRHFYASLLIHNGANVKLVQARHATSSTGP